MSAINQLLDALEAEIDALPTPGRDEKLRALDALLRLRHDLASVKVVSA